MQLNWALAFGLFYFKPKTMTVLILMAFSSVFYWSRCTAGARWSWLLLVCAWVCGNRCAIGQRWFCHFRVLSVFLSVCNGSYTIFVIFLQLDLCRMQPTYVINLRMYEVGNFHWGVPLLLQNRSVTPWRTLLLACACAPCCLLYFILLLSPFWNTCPWWLQVFVE